LNTINERVQEGFDRDISILAVISLVVLILFLYITGYQIIYTAVGV